MNKNLLGKHIDNYIERFEKNEGKMKEDFKERQEKIDYYQSWTEEKILNMDKNDFKKYISQLWAMLIWGNKDYIVNKIINDNNLDLLKEKLAWFIWSEEPIEERWNSFRSEIKGFGPAMMSELLCSVYPNEYMVWNRRAFVGLKYLGVKDLPRYNYQCDGEKYGELCEIAKEIAQTMKDKGIKDADLILVDFFIWEELQVEKNLNKIHIDETTENTDEIVENEEEYEFIHNEIRDKIAEVGQWLGFDTKTETTIADGSRVDTIWEATIGNMGRVIYVFEVQTKGSIDSLILNLLKAMNNPAVQGAVAVSDEEQLEKIKRHASQVPALQSKLRYWDYKEVMDNYENLALVNESINKLGLVPQGF